MKLTRTSIAASTLVIVSALSLCGMTGCGNNASGENASTIGTLASANGATDLSGTWVLNRDLSDHPRRPDSLSRADSTGRPEGWRRHRGGRGPHPDSLHDGRHMQGPMRFVIVQTDSTVEITGPRGRTRTLYTDGRVITHMRDDDSVGGQVSSSWNSDGQLVVEGTGPRGGTRTETFSLSADGLQLIIDTHVDPASDREPRDFRRVFDAVPSDN